MCEIDEICRSKRFYRVTEYEFSAHGGMIKMSRKIPILFGNVDKFGGVGEWGNGEAVFWTSHTGTEAPENIVIVNSAACVSLWSSRTP